MKLVLPEEVSRQIYEHRIWEPGLTRFFVDRVTRGSVVFDIGAHFGYFSLLAVHLGAAVHAFEPTPATCALLRENVGRGAEVQEVAIWSVRGSIIITNFGIVGSAYNSTNSENYRTENDASSVLIEVPAITIDDYVAETGAVPDIIKIDVESAEVHVLAGSQRTIAEHKPLITVEVGRSTESKELLAGLMKRGYQPFEMTSEGTKPHKLQDSYSYDNILLAPA